MIGSTPTDPKAQRRYLAANGVTFRKLRFGNIHTWGIRSGGRIDASGVYISKPELSEGNSVGSKIASLGLRVSRGRTYHGLALNLDMDMSPWDGINACDLGVPITQISELLDNAPPIDIAAAELSAILAERLGYAEVLQTTLAVDE